MISHDPPCRCLIFFFPTAGAVIRQGLLYKRPQQRTGKFNISKAQKLRHFVLTDTALAYYEFDSEKKEAGRLKGYVPLNTVRAVRAVVSASGKDTSYFEVGEGARKD